MFYKTAIKGKHNSHSGPFRVCLACITLALELQWNWKKIKMIQVGRSKQVGIDSDSAIFCQVATAFLSFFTQFTGNVNLFVLTYWNPASQLPIVLLLTTPKASPLPPFSPCPTWTRITIVTAAGLLNLAQEQGAH